LVVEQELHAATSVTNSGSVLADSNAFGARWLVPTLVLEPRILQFSAQISF
jgi:hypothetical protein